MIRFKFKALFITRLSESVALYIMVWVLNNPIPNQDLISLEYSTSKTDFVITGENPVQTKLEMLVFKPDLCLTISVG